MDTEMTDMLVSLEDLPGVSALEHELKGQNILIRRPLVSEMDLISNWVEDQFSIGWANEVKISFTNSPVSCWLAQKGNDILGFACYETTRKNYFGPTGVSEIYRGKGIGQILLIRALESLKHLGYAYAIIGGVGPVEYYQKLVGATIIEGSGESIYKNRLKRDH